MIFRSAEKALLVGVEFPHEKISLDELHSLAQTAGAQVVARVAQKRQRPDAKYFIGSGKVEEIKNLFPAGSVDLVIFDHELRPSQERNLEDALGMKVIDRTELILDIFAQHAHTREGRLQVEMAQATFMLTRLTGKGVQLSRLGGGIGTRGPGETKLETDRRLIRARIAQLNRELEKIRAERTLKREQRRHGELLNAALIGYTNAGKSTLLNSLTRAGVLTANKLFATLDPTTRRLHLPSRKFVLLTDTVGFIQKLPHQLVNAFRATLEEVSEADLLLHVVDISRENYDEQIAAVYRVLEELNCITKPILTILNKADLSTSALIQAALSKYPPACAVSALKKEGLNQLLAIIDDQLLRQSA